MVAAELGNVERMRSLVSATQQYDMTHDWLTQADKKNRTPLHLASIWGYKDVVSFIVDEIIDALDDDEKKKYYVSEKKSNFNPRLCDKNIIFVIHFSHHASHYQ